MNREAAELQCTYLLLATESDELLNAKMHPVTRMHLSLEEQAMRLMEIMHRIAPHLHLAALCWVVVHGDSRPCPAGLLPPSQAVRMTSKLRALCIADQQLRTYGREVLAQARALN
jgi:hypothetical protein